jgi:hypothetical protein
MIQGEKMDPQCNPSMVFSVVERVGYCAAISLLVDKKASCTITSRAEVVRAAKANINSPDFSEFSPCAFQFHITTP